MMRGSNEKMTRSSLVATHHDRRGSCVVMTADGPESSPTVAMMHTKVYTHTPKLFYITVQHAVL